jgi:hypothetical protein
MDERSGVSVVSRDAARTIGNDGLNASLVLSRRRGWEAESSNYRRHRKFSEAAASGIRERGGSIVARCV